MLDVKQYKGLSHVSSANVNDLAIIKFWLREWKFVCYQTLKFEGNIIFEV